MSYAITCDWSGTLDGMTPQRREDVMLEALDGEAVLFDTQSELTHRLNPTALEIWKACDGGSSAREIAARQAERYEVAFGTALDDVLQAIAALAEAGLMTAPYYALDD